MEEEPPVKRQYYVLRLISLLFKIVAVIMFIIALASLAFGLARVVGGMNGKGGLAAWAQIAGAGVVFGWGIGEFMVLYAIGEVLNVLIAIEENTRVTSMRLVRMLSVLGQQE